MSKLRALLLGVLLFPIVANAAITFVAKTNANNSSATSVTPAEPSGAAQNDLILATCVKDIDGGTWTDPADFTQIDQFDIGGSVSAVMYFGYKVRGATAGSGYQFSNSDSAQPIGCTLTAWRGVDTSTPIDVTYVKVTHYNEQAGGDELQAAQPITTATNGAVVVIFWHEQSDTSLTSGPPSGYTERGLDIAAGRQIVVVSKEVPSAGVETPGSWTFSDLATSAATAQVTLALRPASAAPAFSAGPTAGTPTSTTIPFTFTSDTTGTVKGVACPDGQAAPSVAQVIAGDCTGDVNAEATISEAVTGGVGDSGEFTGLDADTTYDNHFAIDATTDSASISSVANITTASAGSAEFSDGPTVTPTTNGYTISGTVTEENATVYAVACAPGDAAPNQSELEAGQCGGGNSALIAASEAWTEDSADSFALTSANKPPRLDVYVGCAGASGDCTLSTNADQDRSADSGQTIVALTSIAATSIFDLDSYYDPDVAAGDVVEHDDTTQNSGCAVSFEADGDFVLTPDSAGDCDGQQYFGYSVEDVSSATTGLFTTPASMFTTDDVVYVNNSAPVCSGRDDPVVLNEDEVMTEVDMLELGGCEDNDGDTMTASVTSGTLPNGTSLGDTGNLKWNGTPDTEDSTGEAITVEICDSVGDCGTYDFSVFVIGTWTVPDCENLSVSDCEEAIVDAAPHRASNPGLTVLGYVCGTGQGFLKVAEQSPAASAEAERDDPVEVSIVGALIPDLTGMTQAEAIAAIEAICP